MQSFETFYLVDRNQPLYRYTSNNIHDVFHEILVRVDIILQFMMDSGLSVNVDTLNFNNLEFVSTVENRSKHTPVVTDIMKFDVREFVFKSTITKDSIDPTFNNTYICNQIRVKLNYSTPNQNIQNVQNVQSRIVPTKTTPNKLVLTKQQPNPVKKLLDETQKAVSSLTVNPPTDQIKSRAIPTVELSEDEQEEKDRKEKENKKRLAIKREQESSEETTSEEEEEEEENEPNIPRPMDSILLKTTDINNMDNITPDELKRAIEELEKIKKQEEKKLKELETTNADDMENFTRFCNGLGDAKREFNKNKEREQERRNKFEANKSAYRKMKRHIIEGKLSESEISPMFRNDYPIYKYMDEKNMLDQPDDYINYLSMYDELYPVKESEKPTSTYVPHNVHYLSDEEQKKYLEIKKDKNAIDDFMHAQTNTQPKKYPSLDEVLGTIDEIDGVCSDITFDDDNSATKSKMDIITDALKSSLN